MSAELRVRVRCVVVCKPSGSQDHINGNAGLKALFPKSKALELVQTVSFGSTINDGVLEKGAASTWDIDCRLNRTAATDVVCVLGILKLERGSALVEQQAGVIVAFVEVLENAGENLRVSEEAITCQ